MTRFGRWFAGGVALVVALFLVALAVPSRPRELRIEDSEIASFTLSESQVAATSRLPTDAVVTPSGLVLPVVGVKAAALTDTFGDPRGVNGERGHGALDIAAPRGTPVVTAADGRVEKLFESERGGHTVYVRSPNRRNIYYYAHLDTYAPGLREGIGVRAGERIGTVGSSGDADPAGPHLHFEIKRVIPQQSWHEGWPINPYPLLAGPAGGG